MQSAQLFIGLMSGTSMDSIDAALVDFNQPNPNLVAYHEEAMPEELKQQLILLCQPGNDEIHRMGKLDHEIGQLFAKAANHLLQQQKLSAKDIIAIGSHGQTIRHCPNHQPAFTLQIGDPNIIAHHTGITTVADFRRRDMAAGGQGAPLATAFHAANFRRANENRVILNIGGIANITLLPNEQSIEVTGFDTGPGNGLLDAWVHEHLNKSYDIDGQWAANGICQNELLNLMLNDPYFSQQPPKTTGREYFNRKWLNQFPLTNFNPQDIQATLATLTATSIGHAIKQHAPNDSKIFVCGGGVHNTFLINQLKKLLPDNKIASTKQLGILPSWVEAAAFAWLAKQTIENKPGNLPSVTNATKPCVLGGIYTR